MSEVIKQGIIAAAYELFMYYGIRSVTMDDVCKKQGISKKTLYLYFPQKEALIEAVLVYKSECIEKMLKEKIEGKNSLESLIAVVKEIRSIAKEHEEKHHPFFYDLQKYYPKVDERHRKNREDNTYSSIKYNLTQGVEEGFYRSDLDIELLSVYHSYHFLSTLEQLRESPRKFSQRRIMEFFIDMIVRYIISEKGVAYLEKIGYSRIGES